MRGSAIEEIADAETEAGQNRSFEGLVSGIVTDSVTGPHSKAALVRVDLPCFLDPGSKVFLDFTLRASSRFGAGDNFDGDIWSERNRNIRIGKPGELSVADECDIGDAGSAVSERELRFGEYLSNRILSFVSEQKLENLTFYALVASARITHDD